MKHLSLVFIISCFQFFTTTAYAQIISKRQAHDITCNFLKSKTGSSLVTPELSRVIPDNDRSPAIYVFSLSGHGFVLIAAEKAAFPVLAYSLKNDWPSGELSDNAGTWIDNYISQVNQIRSSDLKPDQRIKEAWENPLPFFTEQFKKQRGVVPLVLSEWNQGVFYNDSCPLDPQGPGGRAMAGCVPVAMSQILYYHRYPEKGTGFNSYFSYKYGTLSADFGNTTYNWSGMLVRPDRFSPYLSQLIYHCGVSVNAVYSAGGTSAATGDVADGLIQHFGYSEEAAFFNKTEYSDSTWSSMIRINLEQMQPLIYKGSSSGGFVGHAWVCDGYEGDDYFHFNWGWSGFANGYYYLNNLNPGNYNFTFGQGAIFNIHPEDNSPVFAEMDTISTSSGTICNAFWPRADSVSSSYTRIINPVQLNSGYLQIKPEFTQLFPSDSLLIYIGTSTENSPERVFTVNNPPTTVHLENHSAVIRSINHSGNNRWALSYLAHNGSFCNNNAIYHNLNGFLYDGSGNFDLNPETDCRWIISPEDEIVDSISAIQFDFYKFDLSPSDTVFIYEGSTIDSPLLATIPGDAQPEQMQSSGNKLLVRLKTDSLSVSSDGLEIVYYSLFPEYCHEIETITSFSGSISNGSNGYNYHNNTLCQWLLAPENNTGFMISFSKLDTESNRDRIEFYNADSYPEQLVKVVSGNQIPESFTIDASRVRVIFRSDNSIVSKGWEFNYQGKPLSIDDNNRTNIRYYPVPVHDILNVVMPDLFNGGEYLIHNITGKMVTKGRVETGLVLNFNLVNLEPGIYFLTITDQEINFKTRFLKE